MDGPPRRMSCEDDACWVCLEGTSEAAGQLEYPCACPRGVHAKCLARWQLQSAGREEERACRFCKAALPDWRDTLTPKVPAAPPVMAIVYDGKVVRLQVKPGKEGMEEFQRQVRAAFGLGQDVELDCVFDCRAPGTGEKIKLRGLESYSAAMHCAAVAAGERLAKTGSAGSSSGSAAASGGSVGAAAAPGGTAGGAATAGPSSSSSSQSGMTTVGGAAMPAAGVRQLPSPTATGSTATFAAGVSPMAAAAHARGGACLPAGAEDSMMMGGGQEGCGGGGGAGAAGAEGGAATPGRRRSLLSGLFRSLASARRVM
ncbi:hypothetical protein HYH02_013793 [Chlamydomonas schloesseri]|uniref:RING-CH-type domain-containing protein n=1 Tax=Chlamydomonas schloesseri TaxID=2026947 RepID=A0A835VZ40_9CHLO|nr:hypothetical protein HYH02_013793 [Chlamydomonas schloesseri]|eukprot:KAG2430316.1 hypothetical protein HYH02_013793 [Chlamydomonas schloesseri]